MGDDQIDLLCEHCGQALFVFLHEMAEKNAKVVCPDCSGSHDPSIEKLSRLPAQSRPTSPE
jgi:hypothetical protein